MISGPVDVDTPTKVLEKGLHRWSLCVLPLPWGFECEQLASCIRQGQQRPKCV